MVAKVGAANQHLIFPEDCSTRRNLHLTLLGKPRTREQIAHKTQGKTKHYQSKKINEMIPNDILLYSWISAVSSYQQRDFLWHQMGTECRDPQADIMWTEKA